MKTSKSEEHVVGAQQPQHKVAAGSNHRMNDSEALSAITSTLDGNS